jgi:N6-L-threonylcarbamoyladenine synthase
MNVLGIETSCDETAAAVVVDGRQVRSNVISSQVALHQAHGGVVPELAARGQMQAIIPVIRAAIDEAGIEGGEVDVVAFTQGPGLAGSLLVGVNAAKALAMSLRRPMVAVNHLEAHVYANWLAPPGKHDLDPPALPAVCLLVSGGHTELLLIREQGTFEVLGRTIDDAAGEAFDKGARLLGLDYPGGPAIQRAAAGGDRTRFGFPRAALGESLDFSFSGLKTSLLRTVEPYRIPEDGPKPVSAALFPEHRPPRYRDDLPLADLAASYEEAIIDVLAGKTIHAAQRTDARTILIAGGVAANRGLRERLRHRVADSWRHGEGPHVRWPDLSYCTDNAAMVAGLGFDLYQRGVRSDLDADAFPRLPIGTRMLTAASAR